MNRIAGQVRVGHMPLYPFDRQGPCNEPLSAILMMSPERPYWMAR